MVITQTNNFVFWVAAQWSTWIIAFQFYSTALQMKKVDQHFQQKYNQRRGMTEQEINEKKQKKFLERSKERLFGMVDHLDSIKKVGEAGLTVFRQDSTANASGQSESNAT